MNYSTSFLHPKKLGHYRDKVDKNIAVWDCTKIPLEKPCIFMYMLLFMELIPLIITNKSI